MSKLRVQSFAISIDGYGAGPNQDLQNPLGIRGPELMEWFFHTRVWRKMHGHEDGETGVDNEIAEQSFAGIGAWILGRNMFGPVRGPWPDDSWKGWWGDELPYHTPVFVLSITRGRRSEWREVQSSTLSLKAFTLLWSKRRQQQRVAATFASVAAYPLFGSICVPP